MEARCVVAAVIENAASGPRGEPGSGDVLEGAVLPCADASKDDALRDAVSSDPEKQPQQPSTARMGGDEVTEHPGEPLLRSCVSTASMKVKNVKKLTFPRGHFPRLAECAHFHYENVDFGTVQLTFAEEQSEGQKAGVDSRELLFLVQICCQGRSWLVKRSYEDFRVLDKHLHLCIFDRRFSQLTELPRRATDESLAKMLAAYLSHFSTLADNNINCGPVLTWMEIDNKGNHLLVSEESSINVPAIAAAHVTRRYTAQATDELTFEVGDIVSVIDMPPKEDTGWWRGKHGFQVGFFPCDCVELISEKNPPRVESAVPKPVCKKHGKLVTFLRSFMKSRPPPQKLRQRGILKERVFGCDLGEYLHNSGHEVPQVVRSCADFIEKHGVVDGIYRLSGISSNIQKLRHEFDSEQVPDLGRDVFRQDIHSVGSLCKLYFRELPNPLLTYQLYERFSEAVSAATDEERLVRIHNVIQQLPPPHYRTLEFLMRHLSRLATFSPITNMHTKNLAIVWAPNLLRSKQIESACFSGTAAFMEVRIQSVVVEFILNNTEALFSPKLNAVIRESTGNNTVSRPKSLLVSSSSTKLLSLEEAQARTQAQLGSPATTPGLTPSEYIEVGEGPGALLGKFHTVIDLPTESKRIPAKSKKSPVGNWLSFFHLGKSHSMSKRKLKRHPSEPNEIKSIALPGGRGDSGTLRSTKSEESLTSLHNIEVEASNLQRSRPRSRPRSTSEAVSAACTDDPRHHVKPKSSHAAAVRRGGPERARPAAPASPPPPPQEEEDLDLSPPAPGISDLDFDPMSFQCSAPGGAGEPEPVSSAPSQPGGRNPPSPTLGRSSEARSASARASDAPSSRADRPQGPASAAPPPPGAPGRPCSPLSSSSQASALTDLSQSAQNLPDPGADRLMSSVSVLLPHPPLTSAARKLALALAESAQKASEGSQRRSARGGGGGRGGPSHPPPRRPDTPDRRDAPNDRRDRPTRPSALDLRGHPEECCGPPRAAPPLSPLLPSGASPTESGRRRRCPRPAPPQPARRLPPDAGPPGSGSPDDRDADARGPGRDEGPPVGDPRTERAHRHVSVSAPSARPPAPRPARSPSGAAVYVDTDSSVNVFNFRAVLAESSAPASVAEVPSPPADGDRRHHHHHVTPAPHYPRPDALPPHLSHPDGGGGGYKFSSESRYGTLGPPLPPPPPPSPLRYGGFPGDERLVGLHRGQWERPEEGGTRHPAIRRARSFHAPHYSHYQAAEADVPPPPDALFYVRRPSGPEDPYRWLLQSERHPPPAEQGRLRYCYSPYSDVTPVGDPRCYADPYRPGGIRHSQSYTLRSTIESVAPDYYRPSPRRVPRDLLSERREAVAREAAGADGFGRPERESRYGGRGAAGSTASPYEEDPPSSPAAAADDSRGGDAVHARSRSDPGNACLPSVDGRPVPPPPPPQSSPAPPPPRHHVNPEVAPRQSNEGGPAPEAPAPHRWEGASPPGGRIQTKRPQLRKVPSLPERCGAPPKHVEHGVHSNRSHSRGGGRDQGRSTPTNAGVLRRPARSQSIKENRHRHAHAKPPAPESERPGPFPAPPHHRRTQSTKVRPAHHDHAEGYYASYKAKPVRYFPGHGCMSPDRHRLLSKALGHGPFYQARVRSEAGVYE